MKNFFIVLAFFALSLNGISQDFNLTFRSQLPYPGQTLANIWGHVDSLGNEYALAGASQGLSIVDVTNPVAPFEVKQILWPVQNSQSLWKEVKTWGKYAYVVSEAGSGLQIIDLRLLPSTTIPYKSWAPTINGIVLDQIHALHIDNGYAYLYGSNIGVGGVLIVDLADPWNPVYKGMWDEQYIHDGYVRNDTLYAGILYAGQFGVIDVSDKANPALLQTQSTPNNFTHNTWLSDDSKTLFTTDEKSNTFLAAYDVADLDNITELDRFQTTPGSGSIVHNTHVLNDYAVTSWYRDGVNIVDAHRPQNLVQVARYDTYSGVGDGFDGSWGVYPYLPSGNLVVSNIDEGLFVLTPVYNRASYLEGTVFDSICGTALNNVKVRIVASNLVDYTNTSDLSGEYKTGYHSAGTFTVKFSKAGYDTLTVSNVVLTAGNVTNLNVKLFSSQTVNFTGTVMDSAASSPAPGVIVNFKNASNSYTFTTDMNGSFNSCNVVSGTYTVYAGDWRYQPVCTTFVISTTQNNMLIELAKGYSDNFNLDLNWIVTGNAVTGSWERGVPVGTTLGGIKSNPGVDDAKDCGSLAFITGNAGGTASDDDLDDGFTTLTSPTFDLSTYSNPVVNYSRWFFNSGGTGTPNDSLTIILSNGLTTKTIETVLQNTAANSTWVAKSFRVADFITPTANMKLTVRSADAAPGHLVEAGFDNFKISEGFINSIQEVNKSNNHLFVSPNPSSNYFNIQYKLTSEVSNAQVVITDITGRIIHTISLTSKEGNVNYENDLSEGIYFINIQNNNQSGKPFKIIKLK